MNDLEPWESLTIRPGQRYGRYVVVSTYRRIGTYRYFALCQCDCASERKYVPTASLRNGSAQSCGCLHKERVTKHGAWGTPLFRVWQGMMSRCYHVPDKRYKDYGGRGITVCDRWHDVNAFIADTSEGYHRGLQIDRVDNNKGYFKENCRWATRSEQARNKRSNVNLTLNGETLCVAEWSRKLGIKYGTLIDRVYNGWSAERALTTPTMSTKESVRIALAKRYNKTLTP